MALCVVTTSGAGEALDRTSERVANRPEERWQRVMARLRSSPALALADAIIEVDSQGVLPSALQVSLEAALMSVHASDLVAFLDAGYEEWVHRGRDPDFADEHGYLVPYHFSTTLSAGPCRDSIYRNIGIYCTDRYTPIGPDTVHVARLSAACAVRAVEVLQERGCRAVYACTLHPGHHAGTRLYGGYCYLNNAAIAAEGLRGKYKKVAVVDIDYHHGNGTQQIFYQRSDVLTASLHITPSVDYPFYSGYASEAGAGPGHSANLNVPLPPRTKLPAYLEALTAVMAKVKAHGSEALVVAFGGDTLVGDPDPNPNGGLGLEVGDYEAIGRVLAAAGLPTIITQEGGYQMDLIAEVVESFLKGFL